MSQPGQHAGPRLIQRRPLRLIMTACAAAMGLCLVTGLIGIAASIRPSAADSRGAATSLTRGPGIAAPPASRPPMAAAGARPGATITVAHGTRPGTSKPFRIDAPGSWGLAWSYRCTGGNARFEVREQGPSGSASARYRGPAVPRGTAITAAGRSGQGSAWISGDAGRHVLAVTSDCRWTIRVVSAIRQAARR